MFWIKLIYDYNAIDRLLHLLRRQISSARSTPIGLSYSIHVIIHFRSDRYSLDRNEITVISSIVKKRSTTHINIFPICYRHDPRSNSCLLSLYNRHLFKPHCEALWKSSSNYTRSCNLITGSTHSCLLQQSQRYIYWIWSSIWYVSSPPPNPMHESWR